MTPSEVQDVVDQVLVKHGISWWTLPLFACVAGGAAYLGAYFAKKGEQRAARESFNDLRNQLKATTRDAEEIKTMLSGRTWRSQKQWAAREEYYAGLLKHLHLFQLALDAMDDYYMQPGSEHTPDSEMGKHFRKHQAAAFEAYTAVQEMVGPAALYLSPPTLQALDKLLKDHWQLANFGAICTADYVGGALKLVKAAYEDVLREAKAQLLS